MPIDLNTLSTECIGTKPDDNSGKSKPGSDSNELVEELFPGSFVKQPESLEEPNTDLESSEIWRTKRLVDRFYPISNTSAQSYLASEKKQLGREQRLHQAIKDIESEDFIDDKKCLDSYVQLLDDEVFPAFQDSMINIMFLDTPDGRSCGSHAYYMNELLIPTLQSMEQRFSNVSNETRRKVMSALLDFAKKKFNTDHPVFDTQRYEFAVSMIRIGGIEALTYVKGIFDDLSEKINSSEERFFSIMRHELGFSNDTDLVWAYNPKTGEIGYFPKESLAEGVTPLGPQTDEEYLTPSELELSSHEHVLLHKDIVNFLGKFAQENESNRDFVLEFLSEFMKYDSQGTLIDYINVYEDLGIEHSLPVLLGNLKDANILKRRMSAEILFRLELGKVGISREGAEYLGKLYDLGKYNDPDFFLRRLNNQGLMAILDDEGGSIKGVFPLDLYTQEKLIKAEVRQLISQELFLPKADETPLQRAEREEYLKLFIENYESIFNDDFFLDSNVHLNSLNLHEQGWFLMYYLQLNEKGDTQGLERLKTFVQRYGEHGLKAFLALDYCNEPETILDFAECSGIPYEHKIEIFKLFNQIETISLAYKEIAESVLPKEAYIFGAQLHEALVRSSSEFLLAATMIANGKESEVSMQELLRGMRDITKTMIGYMHILKGDKNVELVQTPQHDTEYNQNGERVKGSTTSFVFLDKSQNLVLTVFLRPLPTIRYGNSYGGEARLNVNAVHIDPNDRSRRRQSRVAIDASDYGEYVGDPNKKPVLALDFCLDPEDPEKTDRGDELTRLLKSVPTYQGHHNEASFSPELPQHFPEIVRAFENLIDAKYPRVVK